jgi:hypothetical protein
MGTALTNPERARLVFRDLQMAQDKEMVQQCLFFFEYAELYFVPLEKDFTKDEPGAIENITDRRDLYYVPSSHTYPLPPQEWILSGDDLVVTTDLGNALAAFFKWVAEKGDGKTNYVLLAPGAVITARKHSKAPNGVLVGISFPVRAQSFETNDLDEQARFAITLVSRFGRRMNVTINGLTIEDVGIDTHPKHTALLREYRRKIGDDDKPTIPTLVRKLIESLEARLAICKAWVHSPGSEMLPYEIDVINCEEGILGAQGDDGLIVISGDEDSIRENMLQRIEDEIL